MKRIKITLVSKQIFEDVLLLIKVVGIHLLVNNKKKRVIVCHVVTGWLEEQLANKNISYVVTKEVNFSDKFWNVIEFDEYYRSVYTLTQEQKYAIEYLTDIDIERLESPEGYTLSVRDHSFLKECEVALAQVGWRSPILMPT